MPIGAARSVLLDHRVPQFRGSPQGDAMKNAGSMNPPQISVASGRRDSSITRVIAIVIACILIAAPGASYAGPAPADPEAVIIKTGSLSLRASIWRPSGN